MFHAYFQKGAPLIMTWRETDLLPTPRVVLTATVGWTHSSQISAWRRKEIPGKHCGARESGVHPLCSCLKKSYKLYKTLTQGQNLIDHRLLTFTLMFIQLVKKQKQNNKTKPNKNPTYFWHKFFPTNTANHWDRLTNRARSVTHQHTCDLG